MLNHSLAEQILTINSPNVFSPIWRIFVIIRPKTILVNELLVIKLYHLLIGLRLSCLTKEISIFG